jgi:hypothetical protein
MHQKITNHFKRFSPSLLLGKIRVFRKYKNFKIQKELVIQLRNFELSLNSDSSASADEPFSHYDAFYFWLAQDIQKKTNLKILDLGGKKIINGWLSVSNEVYAVNLRAPEDTISNVNYVEADGSKQLPFANNIFDVFISPVSINLIGLGRYGDAVDANAIPNLVSELDRVMKLNSHLYISIVFGSDKILFNHHIVFSFPSIKIMFQNWEIEDYLIDCQNANQNFNKVRFTKNLDHVSYSLPEVEKIIFLKLKRKLTQS